MLHFSAQGYIIARLSQAVGLGTRLFTSNAKLVGRVIDVFGPTTSPYAAVKPEPEVSTDTLPAGSALVEAKSSTGGGGKRRRK